MKQVNIFMNILPYFIFDLYLFTGRQAVVVMASENLHMAEEMIMEPGLVMIFAHGVE